jgi:hypothetical protein
MLFFQRPAADIQKIPTKAYVTNPTAVGQFVVAGGFTGLPLIFPHRTGAVQHYKYM